MAVSVEGVEISWDRVRDLFSLDPTVAYLNHGAFGAVPIPVQRAQQRQRDEMDANPMAFFGRGLVDRIAHTRRHLAGFLGADPAGTALVPNATAATQLALNAVAPGRGDEIILVDHGYGSTRINVDDLCSRRGASVQTVAVPLAAGDDEIVAALAAAVRPGRTRLAIVDQISSPTAKLFPVARIAAALRPHGVPLFVDAAHVPGMLPVDVSAIGADFWVGNLHKWAFAPRPTAAFVVAPAWRDAVIPLAVSWEQATGFPISVEFAGTLDYTAWLAAPTGVHLLRTLGLDRVRQHNVELVEYGQQVVGAALGVEPADLPNRTGPVSMRLVPLPAGRLDEPGARALQERLATEFGCEVPVVVWRDLVGLRLSAQVYNRRSDYERLADAVAQLIRQPDARAA